jgi:hypothetical protein
MSNTDKELLSSALGAVAIIGLGFVCYMVFYIFG